MAHVASTGRVRALAPTLVIALATASPVAAQGLEPLVGSYAYGWMEADLGYACGLPDPGVLTRVRLGSASFEPDGTVVFAFEERIGCPGGGIEDWAQSVDATYALDPDGRLVIDLDPLQPGATTCTFLMSADRTIGALTFDEEAGVGVPAIGVLLQKGVGLAPEALLGEHTIVRMRESQVAGGLEMRGTFGTLTFLPGNQYQQVVDSRIINPSGSSLDEGLVLNGTYELDPDGTLRMDGGLHVGAVTQDASFGLLIRRASFGSMFAVFARKPTGETTLWALDDLWWLALYGAEREPLPVAEVVPNAEAGVLAFDAHAGQALVGHTEAWVDAAGGGARDGFSLIPFAPRGPGAYQLGTPPELDVPVRLGRAEDVALFAELNSTEGVTIGFAPRSWGVLAGDVRAVDPSEGGVQTLSIRAGAAHAGRPYLVLGSLTGTYPGMAFGGTHLPLDPDRYMHLTLTQPNPPLSGSQGTLDELGAALAAFAPPARWTGLVGSTVYHACVVFEGEAHQAVVLASNAVPVLLSD